MSSLTTARSVRGLTSAAAMQPNALYSLHLNAKIELSAVMFNFLARRMLML